MGDSNYFGPSPSQPLSRNEALLMKIQAAIENGGGGGGGGGTTFKVVESLPESDISTSTIYLIRSSSEGEEDIYSEFVYIDNKWERLGTHQDGTGIDYSKLEGKPGEVDDSYIDDLFNDD